MPKPAEVTSARFGAYVVFRERPTTAEALRLAAARLNVSASEYVRQAVAERLARESRPARRAQ